MYASITWSVALTNWAASFPVLFKILAVSEITTNPPGRMCIPAAMVVRVPPIVSSSICQPLRSISFDPGLYSSTHSVPLAGFGITSFIRTLPGVSTGWAGGTNVNNSNRSKIRMSRPLHVRSTEYMNSEACGTNPVSRIFQCSHALPRIRLLLRPF